MLATFALSGCGSDSSGSSDNAPPVTAARDSDRDGVADTEDAKPFDAEVSARSVSEYFDDDGNLIGTGTYEIRGDGKITAEENVYVAGSDQTSFRAEITYTDSGEVASITIDDELDGSVDFTLTNTYQGGLLIRQVSSGTEIFAVDSDSQGAQSPALGLFNYLNLGEVDILRQAGTTRFEYNAKGSLIAQQTDLGSDGSIEISEFTTYDSADRKTQVLFRLIYPEIGVDFKNEQAFVYAGDNPLPLSELLVRENGDVFQTNYSFDDQGRITLRSQSFARVGIDEVSPDEVEAYNAASTPQSQQALKDSYTADYDGLSGGSAYFDLLYRNTYLIGLVDSGSLILREGEKVETSYNQFGDATNLIELLGLGTWLVIKTNSDDQVSAFGLSNNPDGEIDSLIAQYSYNTQGFLTRSERDFELIDGESIPQQLTKISYGAFGPIYGSLSLSGNSQSAASFAIGYDTYGVITDYRLRSGDLDNYAPYASISHRYVGSSQIDPAKLNLLILGLSEEQSFDSLFNPIFSPVGGPVIGEVGDPVSGGSLGLTPIDGETVVENPDPPVIVVTGQNDVCFGGLSFC